MREKWIEESQAMDSVRLQRLLDVCDTKENTALYLLEEWNYEPQVSSHFLLVSKLGRWEASICFTFSFSFSFLVLRKTSVVLTSVFLINLHQYCQELQKLCIYFQPCQPLKIAEICTSKIFSSQDSFQ